MHARQTDEIPTVECRCFKHLEDEDTGSEEQQSTIQWNGKKWVDHGGENGWSPSKPYQQAHKLSDLVPSLKSMSDLKNPPWMKVPVPVHLEARTHKLAKKAKVDEHGWPITKGGSSK